MKTGRRRMSKEVNLVRARSLSVWIREISREFLADDPFRLAAALAYYTLLSLAPLLLVVVGVAGLAFGREAARGALLDQVRSYIGPEGVTAVSTLLEKAAHTGSELSIVVGLMATLVGATTAFAQLQAAMNDIWGVSTRAQRSAVGQVVRRRLLSLAMIILVSFLLSASLAVTTLLANLHGGLAAPLPATVWTLLNALVSFAAMTILIAFTIRLLPDAKVAWGDAWVGGVVTAALFSVGRYLIGLYLTHAGVASVFGAAGSVVVLMIWIYYASLILFLGAEVTYVRGRHRALNALSHADS